MSDLTDFLLARYAEREAVAQDMQDQARRGRPFVQVHGGGTGVREIVDPARVLADVEAKRRIVKYAGIIAADPTLPSTHLARHVLADLAAPYAGHPDCREEWKP